MEPTYIFRCVESDTGTVREVDLTADQAAQIGRGGVLAYFPRDERISVDSAGRLVRRESAIPPIAA